MRAGTLAFFAVFSGLDSNFQNSQKHLNELIKNNFILNDIFLNLMLGVSEAVCMINLNFI